MINAFSWAKSAYVHFSSSDFDVQGHILSTSRDALRKEPFFVSQLVGANTWFIGFASRGTAEMKHFNFVIFSVQF